MLWEGLTDPICNMIMGRTAENVAEKWGISRDEQDAYAVESHKKAFMATRMGKFKEELVPVQVQKKVAGQVVASEPITQDEGINPNISVQKLALYPTVFKENGTVTPATPAASRMAPPLSLLPPSRRPRTWDWISWGIFAATPMPEWTRRTWVSALPTPCPGP